MGRTHARAWAELDLGEHIKYVCTPHPGPPIPDAPRASFVTDLATVLADDDVDILSVCTPTPTHRQITIRALAAGKNVLLEKPIALSSADALDIAAASERSNGVLMIAHVVRFFKGYRALRETMEAGELGTVTSVKASRLSSPPEAASWLNDPSRSGGPLVDFAIHDFDQLNLFLGTPTAVTAVAGRHPHSIETTVDYADGGTGRVESCTRMPSDYPFTSSLEVAGTRGTGSFRYSNAIADSPYTTQAAYFLRCVREGTPPTECPTDAAILALRVSLAARESLATGRTVELGHPDG